MNRFAEYGLPSKHKSALLMTKAKNAIRRCAEARGIDVSFVNWRNENINGMPEEALTRQTRHKKQKRSH